MQNLQVAIQHAADGTTSIKTSVPQHNASCNLRANQNGQHIEQFL
jgi:hypothetical protein